MSGIERREWTVVGASTTFSDDWRQIQTIMQTEPNWTQLEDPEISQQEIQGYSKYKKTERAKSNWIGISQDTLYRKYHEFLGLFNQFLKLKGVPESIEINGEKKLVRKKIEELTYMTWEKVKDLKGEVGSTEYFCCFGYTEDDSMEVSTDFKCAVTHQTTTTALSKEALTKIANIARKNFEKRLLIRKFTQRVTNHVAQGLILLHKDVERHFEAEQMRMQEEMFLRILEKVIPRYLPTKKKKKPEKLSRLRSDTDSGSSTVSSVKSTDSPPPVETKKAESDTDSSPIPRYSPSPNESKPPRLHIDIESTTSTPEIRAERASVLEDPVDLSILVVEEEEALKSKADF